jgi:hypothetical protein
MAILIQTIYSSSSGGPIGYSRKLAVGRTELRLLRTALLVACTAVCSGAERVVSKTVADTWVFVPPYEAPRASETEGADNHGVDTLTRHALEAGPIGRSCARAW